MKNALYATTALVAAGLIVAAAGDAAAQQTSTPPRTTTPAPTTPVVAPAAAPSYVPPPEYGVPEYRIESRGYPSMGNPYPPMHSLKDPYVSRSAERIRLGLSGYYQQWGVYADQDVKTPGTARGAGQPFTGQGNDIKTTAFDNKFNSEICVIGETTLDNGLTVGVNVQIEANTSNDQIDESYLYLVSPKWGQLIIGDENNAGYLLHVTAPDGGVSLDSGDLVNINAFSNTANLLYFDSPVGTTNLRLTDNDSGKFTYITPRYYGFQAGVSYVPMIRTGGDDDNAIYFCGTNGLGCGSGTQGNNVTRNRYKNGIAGGLNYTNTWGMFGLQASGGIMYFEKGKTSANLVNINSADLMAYNAGAQFSYGGFSVGGAWLRVPNKNTIVNATTTGTNARSIAGMSWTAGAAYEWGPYKVGLDYMWGESEGLLRPNPAVGFFNASQKERLKQAIVSGTYVLGPGIRVVGGVFGYNMNAEDPGNTGFENTGWGIASGLKLAF